MARKFAKIKPAIWRNKKVSSASCNARLLAMYLMTNEFFGMVGIYRLRRCFMSKDTGLTEADAETALNELIKKDFCQYDDDTEMVWVVDMALSQIADKPNEKQLKGARNELCRLYVEEECPFISSFLEKYSDTFKFPTDPDELYWE
jgi:hypothetical protein